MSPRRAASRSAAKISRRGLGAITIRRPAFNVLKKGGQPALRKGATYRYCVKGGKGEVLAAFSKRGRTAVVASSSGSHSAGEVDVGDPAKELRSDARPLGGGLWIERTPPGNRRFVYAVEKGVVRVAGVASRPAGRNEKLLENYLAPLR